MKNKKNKGIIITGGKLEAENISVGDKSKVEITHHAKESGGKKSEEKQELSSLKLELKELLAQGVLKDVIDKMLEKFRTDGNTRGINASILHSTSLFRLEMQETQGIISDENAAVERQKIVQRVIQLIDKEF